MPSICLHALAHAQFKDMSFLYCYKLHFPLSVVTLQQLTTWPPNRHMKRVGTKYVLMRAPFAVI